MQINDDTLHELAQRATAWLLLFMLAAPPAWYWFATRPIYRPPGVLIPTAPVQTDCPHDALPDCHGFTLTRLADYRIQGRLLSARRYSDDQSALAPEDLALGWGAMSDSAVLDKISISQAGRFYFFEYRLPPPIPKREIELHSANNHIIAANEQVAQFIRHLKRGSLIDLRGSLVQATRGAYCWSSSLTREDTGNGACELMYVTQAEEIPVAK